jgi:hypothetical protein
MHTMTAAPVAALWIVVVGQPAPSGAAGRIVAALVSWARDRPQLAAVVAAAAPCSHGHRSRQRRRALRPNW